MEPRTYRRKSVATWSFLLLAVCRRFPASPTPGDELVFDKGMDILLTLDRQFPRFDVGEDFFKPFVDRPSGPLRK